MILTEEKIQWIEGSMKRQKMAIDVISILRANPSNTDLFAAIYSEKCYLPPPPPPDTTFTRHLESIWFVFNTLVFVIFQST